VVCMCVCVCVCVCVSVCLCGVMDTHVHVCLCGAMDNNLICNSQCLQPFLINKTPTVMTKTHF